MAFVSNSMVQPGGDYLLGLLKQKGSIRFSFIYNKNTDYKALAAEAGIDESYVDHAHILIEFAADQLVRAGIVSYTTLPEKLIDGERDYLIELTEKGKSFVESEAAFRYRDMDV